MRVILTGLLMVLAARLSAAPDGEQLQAMARSADVAGLEIAFEEARQALTDGQSTADNLRAMVDALIVSDPTVRAGMVAWLDQKPDSPYAATITAFIRYRDSFAVRGQGSTSETWPAAIDEFRSMQVEGSQLALQAYEAAPDFVPASDAVMTFQGTVRPLSTGAFEAVVAAVMADTPNRGSLQRAAYQALPQWGGEGLTAVARLCSAHALHVHDVPDYDIESCTIDLLAQHDFGRDARMMVADLLMQNDNPIFDKLRLSAGMIEGPAQAEDAMREILEDPEIGDLELAAIYDHSHAIPQGLPVMEPVVRDLVIADIRSRLEVDPYNVYLIRALMEAEGWDQLAPPLLSASDMVALNRDLLVASPYDPYAWVEFASGLRQLGRSDDPAFLSAQINAVAYSRHQSGPLHNLTGSLMRAAEDLAQDDYPGASEDVDFDALELTLCPLVRAERLLQQACAVPDEWDWSCSSSAEEAPRVAAAVADITARGWCTWERTAPLSEIRFLPVPVDVAALDLR